MVVFANLRTDACLPNPRTPVHLRCAHLDKRETITRFQSNRKEKAASEESSATCCVTAAHSSF
jgi:hypothetical protein